jgi:hypothetical protein
MTILLCDGAAIGYMLTLFLCVYGFSLFLWGLVVAGRQGWHVSLVYLYIMGLFGALGYSSIFAVASRYHTLTNPETSHAFRLSLEWGTRNIPLILVLIAIVGHMTYRAFWLRFGEKED